MRKKTSRMSEIAPVRRIIVAVTSVGMMIGEEDVEEDTGYMILVNPKVMAVKGEDRTPIFCDLLGNPIEMTGGFSFWWEVQDKDILEGYAQSVLLSTAPMTVAN